MSHTCKLVARHTFIQPTNVNAPTVTVIPVSSLKMIPLCYSGMNCRMAHIEIIMEPRLGISNNAWRFDDVSCLLHVGIWVFALN
mmetsp:Transcript_6537/g.14294  ORF Transcript_6537/g.14294 Transcript_6537/m.14294 type:complete len:84 (+) Transcript_6537:790-1041(+)